MTKKLLAILLTFCMTASLLPVQTQAIEIVGGSGLDQLGIRQISEKEYAMTPDVKEYEWILNNGALTQQMMGHVMEVKVGEGSTASVAVGYGDDNIEAIASGRNWTMLETTAQAGRMQVRRDTNVVGAINAGGYDMSSGRPSGAFIMNGTRINAATGTTFWIDKSGNAHITSAQECNAAYDAGNVLEAIASFGDIFDNGHARSGLDNVTRASRTAIGIKADGTVVMFMVDGRQAPYSVGMTMAEVAAAMEALGCVQAVNLDGGGSSTFATQREGDPESSDKAGLTLRCRPSDGYERKVSNTIMVLSRATSTGEFDHAILSPNDEVYTPGSRIQLGAVGADSAGGPAEIPADARWTVLSGGGSIDQTGLYTAGDAEGEATVALVRGGKTVGQTTLQLRWPDKLGFTNNSVSIDFGQTSDLTFAPTWQGREVNYKDGDFEWSIDPTYYKFSPIVDPKTNNGKGDFSMAITPDTLGKDTVVVEYYAWGTSLTYTSTYRVTDLIQSVENGATKITAKVVYVSSGGTVGEKKPANLEQTFSAYIGKFFENKFVADEESSLRGTIHVVLANDSDVCGAVDVAVGMEPYILMDFEDHNIKNADGSTKETIPARQYWSCHVGSSAGGSNSNLTADEVKTDRLWVRDTTGKGVIFPEGYNRIVSSEEDETVRFGQYAFKIGYDFTKIASTLPAVADFGFSGDLLVNTIQPTKIGMWVNVPKDCAGDTSVLKAVLKGKAETKALNTAHMEFDKAGNMIYVDGSELVGTAAYVQYYGTAQIKNADTGAMETVTLTTLDDMAGKGWIWVEADISAFQMPIDVSRGYTVRVTSAQNCTKSTGYLYIDNLQFIYGTNTNDITRPVLESITETSSGTALAGDGSTVLNSGNLTFNAVYSDSELTDKYATGIDQSGIRVLLDGVDHTSEVEINDGSLYLKGMALRNGTHTLTIRLKDFYGNVTTESRVFRVEDPVGTEAGIAVLPQPGAPEIGREFTLWIVNQTGEDVTEASLTIDMPAKYLAGATVEAAGSDYDITLDQTALAKGQARITVAKKQLLTLQSLDSAAYDYASELGYLIIRIPADAANEDYLAYTISRGEYTTVDQDGYFHSNSFSGTEQRIALSADYQLTCSQAVAGLPTTITVTDKSGQPVARAKVYRSGSDVPLGTTNLKGQLIHTFADAGEQTLYAEVTNKGRSWDLRMVVCQKTTLAGGETLFGILTNGAQDPETSQSISWISAIDASGNTAQVRYSENADLSGATTVQGSSQIVTFVQSTSGDALRVNRVSLSSLTPGRTYYFQVGDGSAAGWSEIHTFRTADASAESTDFFVLGDIQSANTSKLASVLEKLKTGSFDFAIQTGDAIDNVTAFQANWWPFLTTVNADKLGGTDLIHALGNHEYYGDAEGNISGAIYDLPQSAQNSWYTMDYGKVSVTVINHGADMISALRSIAETPDTDCIWKVLVSHEPIYGTNPDSGEPSAEVLSLIEKAGFDFVFGGDDHAYARTKPMLSGSVTNDTRRGVVYYVCGDLSEKTNDFAKRDCYAVAVPHVDYDGLYLTAQATDERITITAYDWKGAEVDSYTKERTDCELGRHTLDDTSLYRMSDHTLQCTICGNFAPVPETFSGLFSTVDGEKVILAEGKAKVSAFTQMGDVMYHSCQSGYAYAAVGKNNGSCTTSGTITYTCPACAEVRSTGPFMPEGHKWDADHVCTVCGFHGIDISSAVDIQLGTPDKPMGTDAVGYRYNYKPNGTIPYFYASYNGRLLGYSQGDRLDNGKIVDLFLEYQNNKQVGKATVRLSGRGDYYGTKELYYYIYPTAPTDLRATKTMDTYAKLNWTVSAGAEHYLIYQCNATNSSRTLVADVNKTTGYTVTGLEMETDYHFVIYGYTDVDGVRYQSRASNILAVTTNGLSADVTDVHANVNGQSLGLSRTGEGNILFLPASADLSALALTFDFDGNQGALVLSGNLGSITLDSTYAQIDLAALASCESGKYTLTARVGGGDPFTFSVMQGSQIPAIYLTSTEDGHDRDYVDASKDNKVKAALLMTDKDGSALYDGTLKQLKARGNSTFLYAEKKSYQIKLDTPSDLLKNGEQVKTWVLLAGYFDATQMHDKLVKDLAAQFGLAYTANCGWVDLYYDGEYRGLYLLSEKNSIDKTSVDILDLEKIYEDLNRDYGTDMDIREEPTASGGTIRYTANIQDPWRAMDGSGYLLEMNYHTMEEASSFKTSRGYAFNVKSPEWCGKEAMTYISTIYQEFEDAVYSPDGYNAATGKYYYDYVDLDSLVKTFLLQELAYNCDGFRYSQFFYLNGGKLYAGPVWDQEMTFGTGWSGYLPADRVSRFDLGEALSNIPGFMDEVKRCYEETFRPMAARLDGTVQFQYALLKDSAAMNYTLWPYVRVGDPNNANHLWKNADYASVIADLRNWIDLRLRTLDELYLPRPDILLGDVNGDGKVSTLDVRWIRQYLIGERNLTDAQLAAADVNGDGKVSTLDVRWIRQYLIGARNDRYELIG